MISITLMVAETIKTLIFEMLGNAGDLKADGATAEMLMMTARALNAAEQAKKITIANRRTVEAELEGQGRQGRRRRRQNRRAVGGDRRHHQVAWILGHRHEGFEMTWSEEHLAGLVKPRRARGQEGRPQTLRRSKGDVRSAPS